MCRRLRQRGVIDAIRGPLPLPPLLLLGVSLLGIYFSSRLLGRSGGEGKEREKEEGGKLAPIGLPFNIPYFYPPLYTVRRHTQKMVSLKTIQIYVNMPFLEKVLNVLNLWLACL